MILEPRKPRFWEISPEFRARWLKNLNLALFYTSLLGFLVFMYDVGFAHHVQSAQLMGSLYQGYVLVVFLLLTGRLLLTQNIDLKKGPLLAEYLLIFLLALGLALSWFRVPVLSDLGLVERILRNNFFSFAVILYVFFIELSKRALSLYQVRFNPAILFVVSFVGLILLGALLLLLPKATVGTISVLDALFTSASAVCVTGLVVVDTATAFTSFGKGIILVLIQLGGLGIMTFTSFLAMFFQRGASFQNQLFLKDLVNEENLGNTMRTVRNIVAITLAIEAIGAVFIYLSLDDRMFTGVWSQWRFAVFHAISAFCNAGFSTLPAGLFNNGFRFNYGLQLSLIFLIILGGIGFPIIFNLFRHLRAMAKNRWKQYRTKQLYIHPVRVVNINTKLVLITSAVLTLLGLLVYVIAEQGHTLRGHSWVGKLVVSLFGAVTPRTAGFNVVNMMELSLPTVLVYLLLMWVGASPGSTGGGIKTTTFAVAVLNSLSIAKGNERVEVFGREVSPKSVRQAFAVVLLSFLFIGLGVLAVAIFDPALPLLSIVFEVFSAFCTVGLTLDTTPLLSPQSKVVIILTMFVGRVGIFTLISIVVAKVNTNYYRYPTESIIIT